ncbi:unnamed protein product, partial [Thlaspi arvense]
MAYDEEELCKILTVCNIMDDKLSPSEMGNLISLIEDFDKHRISHSEFSESFKLLFEDTELEEDGKKTRFLQSNTREKSLKNTRMSKRLEQVTPSYMIIPEEARCPVQDTVLNNKCRLKRLDNGSGHNKLSKYQEAMATCEDEMFETDMVMGALRSAIDTAEKVMREEMRLEDVGVKFYRCIDQLYGGLDMSDIVREEHKKALPLISGRLKQKLDELTSKTEKWECGWKKIFQDNTTKQIKFDSKKPK